MSLFQAPGEPSHSDLPEGATFRVRVGARLIDMMLHYGISFVAGVVVVIVAIVAARARGVDWHPLVNKLSNAGPVGFIGSLWGAILGDAICEGFYGATLGKRLVGLTVVGEDLRRCTFRQALIRSLAYVIDSLFFGLIAYRKMEESPQRQRLGDAWAHTYVLRRADAQPEVLLSGGRFLGVLLFSMVADGAFVALGTLGGLL